ncbi:MAG: AAA family ATPase, partial [Bryobacterales bacterium]
MLSWISARDYRCLKLIDQAVDPMQILVGPNASGKSTFLDVVSFFGDVVSESIREAVRKRTETFEDLVWGRQGTSFTLAIEARIPPEKRALRKNSWEGPFLGCFLE